MALIDLFSAINASEASARAVAWEPELIKNGLVIIYENVGMCVEIKAH